MTAYLIRLRVFTFRPDGKPASGGWSRQFVTTPDPSDPRRLNARVFDGLSAAKVFVEGQDQEVVNGLGYRHIYRYDILEADEYVGGVADAADIDRCNPVIEPLPA